ncbi:hypothetical protein [Lacipirellula sp.]|uniref:hypothetical protein n=1 Tax=Lacipirellula sp. TaxID=2691419 RepID=UPI003D0D4011
MINDKWFPMFDQFRQAIRTAAETVDAALVPFQGIFDEQPPCAARVLGERWRASQDGRSVPMARMWRSAISMLSDAHGLSLGNKKSGRCKSLRVEDLQRPFEEAMLP